MSADESKESSRVLLIDDECQAKNIDKQINTLLKTAIDPSQIETVFHELAQAADNFRIIGCLDSGVILSLLTTYLSLNNTPYNKLPRILRTISVLVWSGYLTDLNIQWQQFLVDLSRNCTTAAQASACLFLIARLVNENYVNISDIEKLSALTESLLAKINSIEYASTVSIARALHALVLLESSGMLISEKLGDIGMALAKSFQNGLNQDHDQAIPPSQIQQVAQYLWWVHGRNPEGVLLNKLEQLCRPIPTKLQLDLTDEIKQAGYLCVPEGRIGANFCDLVVILKKDKKRIQKDIKKIVIELDGPLHYDKQGNLRQQDQQRDDKLHTSGVEVIRIKTFDQYGKKSSKSDITTEVLGRLKSTASSTGKPSKISSSFQSIPAATPFVSNKFEALEADEVNEKKLLSSDAESFPSEEGIQTTSSQSPLSVGVIPHSKSKDQYVKKEDKRIKTVKRIERRWQHRKIEKHKAKEERRQHKKSTPKVSRSSEEELLFILSTTPKRLNKAWFKRLGLAADKGIPSAVRKLASIYYFGFKSKEFSVEKDIGKAFGLFLQAAESGNAMAHTNLADYYLKGYFVEKDIDLGVSHLERAAALGSLYARWFIALIYISPEYPYSKSEKAMQYLHKAEKHARIVLEKVSGKTDPLSESLFEKISDVLLRTKELRSVLASKKVTDIIRQSPTKERGKAELKARSNVRAKVCDDADPDLSAKNAINKRIDQKFMSYITDNDTERRIKTLRELEALFNKANQNPSDNKSTAPTISSEARSNSSGFFNSIQADIRAGRATMPNNKVQDNTESDSDSDIETEEPANCWDKMKMNCKIF